MKLKPTHPWRHYNRPKPSMDPSLRDAVLVPPAGAPLWDCPVPLCIFGFLAGNELAALSRVSRALRGCLAEETVRAVDL